MHTIPPFPDLPLAALPAPYRLRDMRAGDAGDDAFACALYSSTRDDLRLLPGPPALAEQLIAMQWRAQVLGYRQSYPHAFYLVLEHDGAPVGRLVLDQDGDALRLVDIAILPGERGRGAGSAALRGLQALAGARRLHLALGVSKSNTAARRLYRRLGFELRAEDELQEQLAWSPA